MTDFELFTKVSEKTPIEGVFEVVTQAIYTRNYDTLNLEICRAQINEVLDWIPIKIRYSKLYKLVKYGDLVCSDAGFVIYGHTFQMLDEVEKAINNKAFL